MRRMIIIGASAVIAGLFVIGHPFVLGQQPPIKRTDLLKTDLAGMEGKEMNIWTAEIAPGASTGKHQHPTPRFVVVLEGSVVLEIEGKPQLAFKPGQAFQELPGLVHNLKNASTTEPAKALGFNTRKKASLCKSMFAESEYGITGIDVPGRPPGMA